MRRGAGCPGSIKVIQPSLSIRFLSSAIRHTKYSNRRLNDFNVHISPRCGPCMAGMPEFDRAANQLQATYSGQHIFKLDGQEPAAAWMLDAFGIKFYPRVLLFIDGLLVDAFMKKHSADFIVAYVSQFLEQSKPNYYVLLGVEKTATTKEIKKAYRTVSLTIHPDKVGESGRGKFEEVSAAHKVLSDPQARSVYDVFGAVEFDNPGAMQVEYMARKGVVLELKVRVEKAESKHARKVLCLSSHLTLPWLVGRG